MRAALARGAILRAACGRRRRSMMRRAGKKVAFDVDACSATRRGGREVDASVKMRGVMLRQRRVARVLICCRL